jgi:hypothetical protein
VNQGYLLSLLFLLIGDLRLRRNLPPCVYDFDVNLREKGCDLKMVSKGFLMELDARDVDAKLENPKMMVKVLIITCLLNP